MLLFNLASMMSGTKVPAHINKLDNFSPWDATLPHYKKYLKEGFAKDPYDLLYAAHYHVQKDVAKDSPAPVFLKTHWPLCKMGGYESVDWSVTAGAIYVVRNPLDVTVSLGNFLGKSIDVTIDEMAREKSGVKNSEAFEYWGSWTDNVASWTQSSADICYLRYEDLLRDPELWFSVVARYAFNPPPTSDQLKTAIAKTSFELLKTQERLFGTGKNRAPSGGLFFREGRSGQWRQKLSSVQVDRIVANHRVQMERFSYFPVNF
jgi:hypothetical protein